VPLVAAALGATLVPAAASAAYPRTNYDITYGNSYDRGTMTWYNQGVGISHTLHAASGCREARYYTTDTNNNVYDAQLINACNGSATGSFTLDAKVAGGASYTYVFFYDYSPADRNGYVRYVRCVRTGERPCVYGGPLAAGVDSPAELVTS
jgi:hypothetical protein